MVKQPSEHFFLIRRFNRQSLRAQYLPGTQLCKIDAEVDTMSKTVSSIKGLSHLEGREQASVLWIISHHHLTLELQGSIEYTEATPAATGQ